MIYDTTIDAPGNYANSSKRISVSSYVVVFNVDSEKTKNVYRYNTCHGVDNLVPCGIPPEPTIGQSQTKTKIVRFTVYA